MAEREEASDPKLQEQPVKGPINRRFLQSMEDSFDSVSINIDSDNKKPNRF